MSKRALFAIALMLFSMFFGAGNLIFPPMLGANAGDNFVPAVTGFLISGVALPVLAIIAIALSGQDIRALAARAGTVFTIVFSIAIYLSIGTFFGIPRTGAVSFSTAVAPVTGWESTLASVGFNLVFFAVATWLALNPSGLVDRLGKVLTPALLALLVVLIVLSLFQLHNPGAAPTEEYAASPFPAGLMEGYFTMDSLAALGAGALLGTIYLGLAIMGSRIPEGQSYKDGATLLSHASLQVLGFSGQVVLGGVVLLACLTTAVGLLAATSEFFNYLVPKISYRTWLMTFAVVSFGIASGGLETVISIATPIIVFIYPVSMTVIIVTLIGAVVKPILPLYWGFAIPAWGVFLWSVVDKIVTWQSGAPINLPLFNADFTWLAPAIAGLAIGASIDFFRKEDCQRRIAQTNEKIRTWNSIKIVRETDPV